LHALLKLNLNHTCTQGGTYAALVEAQVQHTAEKLSIGVEQVHEILNHSARSRFRRAIHGVTAVGRFAASAGKHSKQESKASTLPLQPAKSTT
jgi:hypothetical protein